MQPCLMPCRHGYAEVSSVVLLSATTKPSPHVANCNLETARRNELQDHGSSICRKSRTLCVSSSHKAEHIGIFGTLQSASTLDFLRWCTAQGCASPKLEQNTYSPRAACNSGKFGDCRTWRQFPWISRLTRCLASRTKTLGASVSPALSTVCVCVSVFCLVTFVTQ